MVEMIYSIGVISVILGAPIMLFIFPTAFDNTFFNESEDPIFIKFLVIFGMSLLASFLWPLGLFYLIVYFLIQKIKKVFNV